jgi:polysaccharide biosynthesis transport protein
MTPHDRPELGQTAPDRPSPFAMSSIAPAGGALQIRPKTKPAVLATTPNVFGLLQALKRRWILAFSLAVVGGAAAAAGAWFTQQTTYTARSVIQIKAEQPFILNRQGSGDYSSYKLTQMMWVRSAFVINKALNEPKVKTSSYVVEKEEPVLALQRDLQVDFGGGPEFMRIGLSGLNPNELVDIVNAVRKIYVEDILEDEKAERMVRLKMLTGLKTKYDRILKESRKTLNNLLQGVGSAETKTQELIYEILLKQTDAVQNQLVKFKSEKFAMQVVQSLAERPESAKDGSPPPNAVLDEQLKNDPKLAPYYKSIADLEHYIKVTEERMVDPAPVLSALKKRLENANKELKVLLEKLGPEHEKRLEKERNKDKDARKKRLEDLEELEKWWTKERDRLGKELATFKKERFEAEELRLEVVQQEEIVKQFTKSISALQVELDAPARWKDVEQTTVNKDTDARLKKCAMAGGGTFAFFILGVALLEFRKRRVNTVDEVVHGLELRLMGTVPAVPDRAQRGLGTASDPRDLYWQGILAESVDAARTMLLHMARQEAHKVVMITSAIGGEGKTLLSCHLAASLARAGFRTLLVDCDLRRPSVHQLFGLSQGPGFSELLCDEVKSAEALQSTPVPGLSVVAAGDATPTALQALAHHKSKEIFANLKEQFDFVLVDSAPVLAVSDTSLIAQGVDGVMLSVLREVSLLPSVFAAYERLIALQVRILGAVVSGVGGDDYRARYAASYQKAAAVAQESALDEINHED